MSIAVAVGLLSGRTVSVEAGLDESVATLKRRAQTALAVGNGRLLRSWGRLLDEKQIVKEAKLETETLLTLQVSDILVGGNFSVYWAILGDGSVVPGTRRKGRRQSCRARPFETRAADPSFCGVFAAILDNGSVVSWGPRKLAATVVLARLTQRRASDPRLSVCCCSYPDRRIGCSLHPRGKWRRHSCRAESAETRAADSSVLVCSCGHPG